MEVHDAVRQVAYNVTPCTHAQCDILVCNMQYQTSRHSKCSVICTAADRFDEMNGAENDDDDGDDSEPKAKAKPRAKKSKTNADGEEKKPRAPGKPVRSVSMCMLHIQAGTACATDLSIASGQHVQAFSAVANHHIEYSAPHWLLSI